MRKTSLIVFTVLLILVMVMPVFLAPLSAEAVSKVDLTKPVIQKATLCGKVTVKTVEFGTVKAEVYVLKSNNKEYVIIPVNAVPMKNRFQYISGYLLSFKVFGKNIFFYAVNTKGPQPLQPMLIPK